MSSSAQGILQLLVSNSPLLLWQLSGAAQDLTQAVIVLLFL
jgi:hypothetical protein